MSNARTIKCIAVSGAILSAGAYTAVRALRTTERPLVILFYFPLMSIPWAIPLVAPVAVWPTPVEWLLLLGVGVTTQIAQIFLTYGLYVLPAGTAMAVSYLQILFATMWGILVFDEIPDGWAIAGGVLVMLATLTIAMRANQPPRSVVTENTDHTEDQG